MSDGPFVVVVAGATPQVGSSTIAGNLAVYLKALREELPVAILGFGGGTGLDEMFSLGDGAAGTPADLFAADEPAALLRTGQFGVSYLSSRGLPPRVADPTRLRRILARDRRQGVVVIDAGNAVGELWRSALWAADLVLAPVGDHRTLPALTALRRTLADGGGCAEMLWLLPSRLDAAATAEPRADAQQLLRLAAAERGCQVLEQQLDEDRRVQLTAAGPGRSVLTRLPGSAVHEQLRQLAAFVLDKFAAGPVATCRIRRMLDDGRLPPRARRVDPLCPLCGTLAVGPAAHYLESLPKRYRCLLHAACLELLLQGTALRAFLPLDGQLLVKTGIEGRGLRGEIRLLLSAAGDAFVEQQQLLPATGSGWDALLRTVTGRGLNEQEPGLLAISVAGDAASLLTPARHRRFAVRRRRAFRMLHNGEG